MPIEGAYLHAFNLMPQLGPVRLLKICENFETLEEAYLASAKQLLMCGLEAELADAIVDHRQKVNLDEEASKLKSLGINILTYKNKNYPKLLLEIPKFPPLLYYRGQMDDAEELCIAVVGTRNITTYGRSVIPDLVAPLVDAGAVVVSGM